MPNILLEGMAAGLPIACSDRGPMPEVLGDAGVYFNPEDPASIAKAIRHLIESPELREQKAQAAFQRAQQYSWARCAEETFGFLVCVLDEHARVGLGHVRLSIIDLSPLGHQTMWDITRKAVIVFNGEIYNYRELRRELEIIGRLPVQRYYGPGRPDGRVRQFD